jgi:hypothetical protein
LTVSRQELEMMMGKEPEAVHTCREVGKAIKEAEAPRAQPIAQNRDPKGIPVPAAVGRHHRPRRLSGKRMISSV